jgi:hypothetical protein
MEGRQDDIKVEVDGSLVDVSKYAINGNTLNFLAAHQPDMGARLKIYRETNHSGRLADFTDGSLLKAETLDLNAQQLFNMAQEAFDQASYTQIGGSTFYYTSDQPPTDANKGTLWYDISPSVNELKVWNGEEWYAVAPLVENYKLGLSDRDFLHNVPASPITIQAHVWNVPNLGNTTEVYLNGVRLTGKENTEDSGDDPLDAFNDGDIDWVAADITNDGYKKLFVAGTITAGDVLTVTTVQGGFASSLQGIEAQVKEYRDDAAYYAMQAEDKESVVVLNIDVLQDFATKPEDESFIYDGETFYSALHYSEKAEFQAQVAQSWAQQAGNLYSGAVAQVGLASKHASHPEDVSFTDDSGEQVYSALHYKEKAQDAAIGITSQLVGAQAVKLQVDDVYSDTLQVKTDTLQIKADTLQVKTDAVADTLQVKADTVLVKDAAVSAASDASLHKDAAEESEILAQQYANSSTEFLVDGVLTKSAKMHTDDAVSAVQNIDASIAEAESVEQSLRSTINDPANEPISIDGATPFYSARHYAAIAETAANQTVDNLVGWDLVDANTISTTATGAPVIHSGTTIDLQAVTAVQANGVPLPAMGGSLNFDTNNYKGFKNQTVGKTSGSWEIIFDTPFDYTSDYSIIATYAGSDDATVRVVKATNKVTLSVYATGGGSIQTGEIAVTLYKFT